MFSAAILVERCPLSRFSSITRVSVNTSTLIDLVYNLLIYILRTRYDITYRYSLHMNHVKTSRAALTAVHSLDFSSHCGGPCARYA